MLKYSLISQDLNGNYLAQYSENKPSVVLTSAGLLL